MKPSSSRALTVTRAISNMSRCLYTINGVVTAGTAIISALPQTARNCRKHALSEGETLVVDTDKMTAYVVDENGETLKRSAVFTGTELSDPCC